MNDEKQDLSKTLMFVGKPGGKFYEKTFDEVQLRDLDWLVGQPWLKEPIRSKLVAYLAIPPITRALEKELNG
jgi:hypothetical protein